jgi:hypothetical protein
MKLFQLASRFKSQTKPEEGKITYDEHRFRIINERARAFHMLSRRMTSVLFVRERLVDAAAFLSHIWRVWQRLRG